MSRVLYGIGGFCVRNRYPVLAAWIVLVIATVGIANAARLKNGASEVCYSSVNVPKIWRVARRAAVVASGPLSRGLSHLRCCGYSSA